MMNNPSFDSYAQSNVSSNAGDHVSAKKKVQVAICCLIFSWISSVISAVLMISVPLIVVFVVL